MLESVPFKPKPSALLFALFLTTTSSSPQVTLWNDFAILIYTWHQLRNKHLSRQSSTRTSASWVNHPIGQPKEEHLHSEVFLQFWAPTLMRIVNMNWTWSKNLHKLAWITKNIRTSSTYWNPSLLHLKPQEHSLPLLSQRNRCLRTFKPQTNQVDTS